MLRAIYFELMALLNKMRTFLYDQPTAPTATDISILRKERDALLARFAHLPVDHGLENRDLTAYEWLQQNADTSEFVRRLEKAPSVAALLRDEHRSCTVWATTNAALARFNDIEGETEALMQHHVSPHDTSLSDIVDIPNIPCLLNPSVLNGQLLLRFRLREDRIQVDGHANVLCHDIGTKNGTIHLVDRVIELPPRMSQIISTLPERGFCRLRELARDSGFLAEMDSLKHVGGTFFAPTDEAFTAYEGSRKTQDLSTAEILRYHMVPNETLYSNIFYHGENLKGTTGPPIGHKPRSRAQSKDNPEDSESSPQTNPKNGSSATPREPEKGRRVIEGTMNFPLPTMLAGSWINVRISRSGGVISMRVREGEAAVILQDITALDGVIHVIDRVLERPSG